MTNTNHESTATIRDAEQVAREAMEISSGHLNATDLGTVVSALIIAGAIDRLADAVRSTTTQGET